MNGTAKNRTATNSNTHAETRTSAPDQSQSRSASTLKVIGIDHVGLDVQDIARSKAFYVDLLGMEPLQDMGRMSFLRCGNQMLTLVQIAESPAPDPTGSTDEATSPYGMNHIALRLQAGDYEHVKSLLNRAGYTVVGRRGDIYVSDPDGYEVQLLTTG